MGDRVFWDRITIGGVEYPRARGTLRVVETAPPTGAYLLPRGAVSFSVDISMEEARALDRFIEAVERSPAWLGRALPDVRRG